MVNSGSAETPSSKLEARDNESLVSDGPDVDRLGPPELRLRLVGAAGLAPKSIFDELRSSIYGQFYLKHLRDRPIVRYIVLAIWRRVFPIVAKCWFFLARRKASMTFRLVSLRDYAHEYNITRTIFCAAQTVDTPKPAVQPASDEGMLVSPHQSYTMPEMYVARLRRAMVTGASNLTYVGEHAIHHDLFTAATDYTSEELHGRILINLKRRRVRLVAPDRSPERIPTAASFLDACASNYAHWMTEVLPRIAMFCSVEQYADIPLIINDGLHPNILQSLKAVVGEQRELLAMSPGRSVIIEELYCPSVAGYVPFERRAGAKGPHSHGKFNPVAISKIRVGANRLTDDLHSPWAEKILLRRRGGIRAVTNFDEIEQNLVAQGFVTIEPERLTFAQQAHVFRNAKFIVGSSGAAFANLVFVPADARVFIMIGRFPDTSYWYWQNIACSAGATVRYILGDIEPGQPSGIHADFKIPLDLLLLDIHGEGGIISPEPLPIAAREVDDAVYEGQRLEHASGEKDLPHTNVSPKAEVSKSEGAQRMTSRIDKCHMMDLPRINDPRGNLTYVEANRHFPFDIKRVYYLYDVPGGAERGGHAHRALHQLIIAMSGSFDIHLDDGTSKKTIHLNRSYNGLYVCPGIWREMDNFSSGAVCMVLASEYYGEADYYREYDDFIADVKAGRDF